jgi:hypothetical protein
MFSVPRWNESTVRATVCLVLWLGTGVYLLPFVDRGWIAHDDGMLGQAAERVLAGELPHRDFDDPYTGGLAYLHALALEMFGVRLLSLRWLLFGATLAWVPAVYYLAARFVPPLGAALVTAAAVTWSVPNYFAGLPSYYNLFLATFGTAALFRHLEGRGRVWLVVAGICGGLSFLVKSVGALFVVAGGLFLLFRAQIEDARDSSAGGRRSPGVLLVETAGGLALIAALVRLLGARRTAMDLLHFVAPFAAVVGVLLWSEWRDGRGALPARCRRAWALVAPFAAGAAAPVALFLIPYVVTGSLADFSGGVFLSLDRRFGYAERPLPPAGDMVWAVPYGAALLAVALGRHRRWTSVAAGGAALAFLVALATIDRPASYLALWNSARFLSVFAVLAGCALLLGPSSTSAPIVRQQAFLLLAVLAAAGLVQFPFAAPIYFCYTAPLLLLAILPVVRLGAGRLHLTMLLGYLAFAVVSLNVGYIWNLGVVHQPGYPVARVAPLDRARIRIPPADGYEYLSLVTEIRTRIPAGEYVYATPDCPEVYFLAGARNPTRDLYEFLAPSRLGVEGTLDLIERHGIKLVVINREPHFSGAVDPAIEAAIESRLPHSAIVGRFLVRWRT